MALLLRSLRRRQPAGPVGINWDNPLTRGLQAFAYPTTAGLHDAVTRNASAITTSGTLAYAPNQNGLAVTTNGSSYINLALNAQGRSISLSSGFTLAVLAAGVIGGDGTSVNFAGLVGGGAGSYTNDAAGYLQTLNNSGVPKPRCLAVAWDRVAGSISVPLATATAAQQAGMRLYMAGTDYTNYTLTIDGDVLTDTGIYGATPDGNIACTSIKSLLIGGVCLQDSFYYSPSDTMAAVYWNRKLSSEEMRRFYENIWALLEDDLEPHYFDMVAGSAFSRSTTARAAARATATAAAARTAAAVTRLRPRVSCTTVATRSTAVVARAGRPRAAVTVAKTRTQSVTARIARPRATLTVAATRTTSTATRLRARSTCSSGLGVSRSVVSRLRPRGGAVTVTATRTCTIATRVRARTASTVAATRAAAIVSRARLRAQNTVQAARVVTVVARVKAARARVTIGTVVVPDAFLSEPRRRYLAARGPRRVGEEVAALPPGRVGDETLPDKG